MAAALKPHLRWRGSTSRRRPLQAHLAAEEAAGPVICGAVILTIGLGARSFGIFQQPIALNLNGGRELWSFGNALSMLLMGALAFVGNVADRFGTARTGRGGGAVYVVGMLTIAAATESCSSTLGNVSCVSGGGAGWPDLRRDHPPDAAGEALDRARRRDRRRLVRAARVVPFACCCRSGSATGTYHAGAGARLRSS